MPLYIQRARRGRLAQAIALEESAEDSTAKGEHDQAKTLLAEALVKLAEIHDAAMLAKGASAKTADQQYVIDVTSQTAALVALAGANMNASSAAQASFVLSQALEQQRTLAKWARAKGLEL